MDQVNGDNNVQKEAKTEYENLLNAANSFYNRNLAYNRVANEKIPLVEQKKRINNALCSGTLSSKNRVSVELSNDMKLDDKFVQRTENVSGLRVTQNIGGIKKGDILHKINSTDVSSMTPDAQSKR